MGNPKLFYVWGKNVEKVLATSCIQFQTGVACFSKGEFSYLNFQNFLKIFIFAQYVSKLLSQYIMWFQLPTSIFKPTITTPVIWKTNGIFETFFEVSLVKNQPWLQIKYLNLWSFSSMSQDCILIKMTFYAS